MFKVGSQYKITTDDGTGQGYSTALLIECEMPLIKIVKSGREIIINTSSPGFVSAERDDEEVRAAIEASHAEFMKSVEIRFVPGDEKL